MSDWKSRFFKFLKKPAAEPPSPPSEVVADAQPIPELPMNPVGLSCRSAPKSGRCSSTALPPAGSWGVSLAPMPGGLPTERTASPHVDVSRSFSAGLESILLPDECPSPGLTEDIRFVHPFSGESSGFEASSISDVTDWLEKAGQGFEVSNPAMARWIQWRTGPHACAWIPSEPKITPESLVYSLADARLRDTTIWHRQSSARAWTEATAPDGHGQAALLWMQVDWAEEWAGCSADWRDAWSGRLLHSWLMAHVLKTVTDACGPESVLYPWLRGQPWYDRLNQAQLKAAQIKSAGGKTLWEIWGLGEESSPWLTPSLPNGFLALVPSHFDVRSITSVLDGHNPKSAWRQVSDACWEHLKQQGRVASGQRRAWDYQTSHAWRVGWQLWPWKPEAEILESLGRIREVSASQFTRARQVAEAVVSPGKAVADLPAGWTWAAQLQLLQHHLRARQETCDFAAVPSASSGDQNEPSHPEDLSAMSRIREVWLETEVMRPFFPGQDPQVDSLRYSATLRSRNQSSAGFQPAVSRISNPPPLRPSNGLQTGSRRHSRLEICATISPSAHQPAESLRLATISRDTDAVLAV